MLILLLTITLKRKKIRDYAQHDYVIEDLNGEEITGNFYEQELGKTN